MTKQSIFYHECGFVLPLVMFFLLILSVLVLGVLEAGLLETKSQGFYQDKIKSFYIAENKLLDVEKDILAASISDINKSAREGVKIIDSNVCGVVFYRINVSAEYNGAKTFLESTFSKVNENINDCDVKPNKNIEGRQSFLMIRS